MKKRVTAMLCVILLLNLALPSDALASVDTNPAPPPDVAATLYQVRDGDAAYVEPANSYNDGTVTYYLLTQDAAKSALTSVAYEGVDYPLAGVYVGTSLKTLLGNRVQANRTIFVDDGIYQADQDYVGIDNANFSLVGLNKQTNGEPTATLVRSYGTAAGTVDQHRFISANVYIGNVILDGAGKNMGTDTSRGLFAVVVSSAAPNFVMKDVIIQNVGASNTAVSNRNVALQSQYGQNGPHHFINLTVRNVKTSSYGAGVIFTNQSNQNYFKNLTLDASAAASNTRGVRVENANLSQMPDVTQNSAVFAGTTAISTGYIQVQDYRYDLIAAPAEYRYVEYYRSNGNANTGTYRIWNTIPACTSSNAILDRQDNYWVVREGQGVTVNAQIASIASLLTYMAGIKTPALPGGRIPGANIKLVADGALDSFNVANFGAGAPVHIVAADSLMDLCASGELVPVASGFTASLGATANAANVTLYNFDFASLAQYTLHEAVKGVTSASVVVTDPYDLGAVALNLDPAGAPYPPLYYHEYAVDQSAKITGEAGVEIAPQAFSNCRFTVLRSGAGGDIKQLVLSAVPSTVIVGSKTTILVSGGAYTDEDALPGAPSLVTDDGLYAYSTSDPAIATVDKDGVVTGVAAGTVEIYVKATDRYNAGEIEKPYGTILITVMDPPPSPSPSLSPSPSPTKKPSASAGGSGGAPLTLPTPTPSALPVPPMTGDGGSAPLAAALCMAGVLSVSALAAALGYMRRKSAAKR